MDSFILLSSNNTTINRIGKNTRIANTSRKRWNLCVT